MTEIAKQICGVLPPIPTFLQNDGQLYPLAQERLVSLLFSAGVDGVVLLGTSGEGPVLSAKVRATAIEVTVTAAGAAPVVVGCSGQTTAMALDEIGEAADRGASAVLLLPPFYFLLSQVAVCRYFEAVADASPLPIILYNIPGLTRNGLDVESVERLAGHPRILGIKDSSRDFAYFQSLSDRVASGSFRIFQGAAPLVFASAVAGWDDSICPVTALVPEWELDLRSAVRKGDLNSARHSRAKIVAMARLFNLGDVPMPINFKVVAELLGHGPAMPHDPQFGLDDPQRLRLETGLRELGFDIESTRFATRKSRS